MSRSNRRQRGNIWKKAPTEDIVSISSAKTPPPPPIRPSNSFMEKVLGDCLKPKKLVWGDGSSGVKSQNKSASKKTQPKEYYAPMTDFSFMTPPRRSWDSRHYQPRDYRVFADNVRTTPPRNTQFQLNNYGRRSAKTTPPSIPYLLHTRDSLGESDEITPLRSSNLWPRENVTNTVRTVPRRTKYFRSSNLGAERVQTAPLRSRNDSFRRDYGPIRTNVAKFNVSSRTQNQERKKPNHVKSVTPRTAPRNYGYDRVRGKNDIFRRDYGPVKRNVPIPIAKTPSISKSQQPKKSDNPKAPTPRTARDSKHQQRNERPGTQPPFSSSPLSFSSFQEEREQALRDYKVTIEYKHLKSHAPGGVYLIPSMDSLRNFHGIIFVRRGPFTNGIFKFKLDLPAKYNDTNMWPKITFQSKVYNPYVNEKTGELDVQSAYPTWDPSRHYLVTVLTYLKKIFYSKNFADAKANPAARELAGKDPAAYKKKVEGCVHESQKKVYVNEKGSTAKFTEEEVAHRVLRDLLKHHIRNDNQVTKQTILAQVEKSRKV
eukprot:CAMPEP_0116153508 /NCGR_PEP_ID=MMETSP0329-20121206/21284_1 /TAXON_ID=697910 /ORGANISM="Pseudo-nitzschia arenysensis, Strain B593" /LENGTH=541 /DNA_ID=CAMNT_0003650425 /DNA_START=448 /DNA_END=2073 /DNA_ORIENTATION=-